MKSLCIYCGIESQPTHGHGAYTKDRGFISPLCDAHSPLYEEQKHRGRIAHRDDGICGKDYQETEFGWATVTMGIDEQIARLREETTYPQKLNT